MPCGAAIRVGWTPLRFLKNAIQMTEKDQMKELDETGVLDVVAKQVKDRRESIRMFQEGGRDDPGGQRVRRANHSGGVPAAPTGPGGVGPNRPRR